MTLSRPQMQATVLSLVLMTALTIASGCSQSPQVSGQNREIITSLATAVSTRNTGWLESNAKLIDQRHSEGKLVGAEYEALKSVVALGKAGDWTTAETEIYALRDSQEPTSEDLQNLAQRKLGSDHGLPRTLKKGKGRIH